MDLEIRIATDEENQLWNGIVSNSPHGTIFHTWEWLKITEKYSQCKLVPLIGLKGENPVGILPLFFRTVFPLRMAFSPPPQVALFFLGPILIDFEKEKLHRKEQAFIDFLKGVDQFLSGGLKPNYTVVGLPPGLPDPRPYAWAGYEISNAYDYITDLRGGIDTLWQQLHKNVRQNITRAMKKTMQTERGGRKELEILYDLMVQRYREQGKKVKVPKEYLVRLQESLPGNIGIYVTKYNGEIVTGSIEIFYKNEVISWIGNPRPMIHISPSPNDLHNWEVIRQACEQGFFWYTTPGAAGDRRLHEYYSSKLHPELRIRYVAKRTSGIARLLEPGYSHLVKPLMTRLRNPPGR